MLFFYYYYFSAYIKTNYKMIKFKSLETGASLGPLEINGLSE